MGRIRTTLQAREIRAKVLRIRESQRWQLEYVQLAESLRKGWAEVRQYELAAQRREAMKKFRHRRPTSL